jgi:hypothetical protein
MKPELYIPQHRVGYQLVIYVGVIVSKLDVWLTHLQ